MSFKICAHWNLRMRPCREIGSLLRQLIRMNSSWMRVALNPTTGVLVRGEETQTQKRSPVRMEAETGGISGDTWSPRRW